MLLAITQPELVRSVNIHPHIQESNLPRWYPIQISGSVEFWFFVSEVYTLVVVRRLRGEGGRICNPT